MAEDPARRSRPALRWVPIIALVAILTISLLVSLILIPRPRVGPVPDGSGTPSAPQAVDTDGDGLIDEVEEGGWKTATGFTFRTDPTRADTDGDGVSDREEAGPLTADQSGRVYLGVTDPTKPDSDDDGLGDLAELRGWSTLGGDIYRTDPLSADADGDGLLDGDEAGKTESRGDGSVHYAIVSNPHVADSDGDGLNDADKVDLGLDPFDPDADDDQLADGRDAALGHDPRAADTDGDGFTDAFEDANREGPGLDPIFPDVKVDKWQWALEFARGAVLGDLAPCDSIAWMVGNLASGGVSLIPGVGWIVGTVADVRDVIGAAIRADWVAAGFNAAAIIPNVGDAAAVPSKVGKFVTPEPPPGSGGGCHGGAVRQSPAAPSHADTARCVARVGSPRQGRRL